MNLRSLHPNIRLRLGVGFVQRLLSVMLVPLMVIHLAALYGAAAAGVLTLVVAAAGIAANIVGGHLADVLGRRPLLVAGEAGAAGTFALMALVNSPWLQSGIATFVLYLANTCLAGAATPAADAMVVDVSTPKSRTVIYTINYWSINLAFMAGSLVGGFLYGGHFFLLLAGGAVLSVATALVTWRWIAETAPQHDPVASPAGARAARGGPLTVMLRSYLTVARDRVFLRLLVAAVLTRSIEVQLSYYIAVRLSTHFPAQLLGIGSWHTRIDGVAMLGVLRAVNTALVVALALFAASLFGRLSERVRLYAGITLFTAGYMVWAVSDSSWVLIGAAVVLTIGEVVNVPVKQAILADLVDPQARSTYMAAYGLNARAGLLVGSLFVTLGAFVPAIGIAALYAVFGATAVLIYRSLLRVRGARTAAQASAAPAADPKGAAV